MIDPKTLGRTVARAQDRLNDEPEITNTAESILFNEFNPMLAVRKTSRIGRWRVAAAVALLLVTAGVVVHRLTPPPALSVTVNGRPEDPGRRRWVHDPAADETTLAFSDGSRVLLKRDARTRFIDITPRGAGLLLEQGRLVADIAHLEGADWRFFAGPFEVRVKGTRFTLDWHQQREFFSVVMDQGSVEIRGPSPSETRLVSAGETFAGYVHDGRIGLARRQDGADAETGGDAPAAAAPADGSSTAVTDALPSVSAGVGDEPAAPAPAKKPSSPCGGPGPAARLEQADAARLAGEGARAAEHYTALRQCFPHSGAATMSAFYLGKIAFDRQGDWDRAARWFERYLAEQRGEGPVREAMGRLMEAYRNGKRRPKARTTARRYLSEYPDGPHAAYATSLLEEGTDSTVLP